MDKKRYDEIASALSNARVTDAELGEFFKEIVTSQLDNYRLAMTEDIVEMMSLYKLNLIKDIDAAIKSVKGDE